MPDPAHPSNPDRLVIGCGYLGRRVAQAWLRQGRHVFATTRRRPAELRALGFDPVIVDVLDPATLDSLPGVGTVVYCIGLDRTSGASMRDVYVEGLANVLNALPPSNRLIYVSSTSVYGQIDGRKVDETAPTEPLDESGRIVLDAERLLRRERPDAIVLRFAGIYGPGRLLRRRTALENREPIAADPAAWLNLIHVDDGTAAVLAAESRGAPGEMYNVSDGHPVRRGDFYRELARVLNAPPTTFALASDKANRRIVSRRIREELDVTLRYPSYVEGLAASIEAALTASTLAPTNVRRALDTQMSRNRIEFAFLFIALVWPTAAAWLYFVAAAPDNPAVPILYSAGKVVQFALPLLCWALTDRSRFAIPKPTRAGLMSGVAFGVIVFGAIVTLYFTGLRNSPFLSGVDAQVRSKVAAMGLDSRAKYILFVLFLSLLHAGLEEYYWREFVFAGLCKHLPLTAAVVVSSLGFMGHHVLVLDGFFPGRFWTATVPFSLAIAFGGAVWAYQYHRFKSIYPAWLGHALVDLAIMAVGYDLVFSLDTGPRIV